MEQNDIEKALYIIQLKIAKEIRENKLKNYKDFKEKITNLQKEKDLIYKGDEYTIEKVLKKYINDVKKE